MAVGISNILALLGGVALFLFGMGLMGDSLKLVAGQRLELILYRLSNTPLKGVLLGAFVTAVIQSSSATTVMVVGFVNSGMMTLRQAVWVIMGANIGTTITGQLIALPIMGGGMGAGAVPLSKIFESSNTMTAAEAISVMTPAVAIGNAISIVFAGIIVKVIANKTWNGQGALMQAGSVDPKELEISPEMQAKRDKIDVKNLGIGLFVSNSFFAWGFIVAKLWSKLVPSVSIHAYAWMIITVAICKIFNLLPENIEVACYQWFQFVMKNLTTTLLVGIGLCYLSLDTVIESFSVTYLILCLVTCVGAFFGAAIVGKWVGFYPVEAGITAGLCMANMGGTGDVAVLSAADRMELMPFAQISSRLGGAIILILGSLLLSTLGALL